MLQSGGEDVAVSESSPSDQDVMRKRLDVSTSDDNRKDIESLGSKQ